MKMRKQRKGMKMEEESHVRDEVLEGRNSRVPNRRNMSELLVLADLG